MLTQAQIDVFANPSPDQFDQIVVLTGKNCTGGSIVASLTPSASGPVVIPFEPGVPIPSGSGVSVYSYRDLAAEVHLTGYSMPTGAVPAQSAVISKTRSIRRARSR